MRGLTQKEGILALFRSNGNKLTLGQILQHPYGYEVRARFSELRKLGYSIEYFRGKTPSENTYILTDKQEIKVDEAGQTSFI